jgi:AraC family transcriptional regulator
MGQKLVSLHDGNGRPLAGVVTHSSADTSWPGFPIESRRLARQGEMADVALESGCLALCVRGRSRITIEGTTDREVFEFAPGRLSLGRPGDHIKQLTWNGEHEAIVLQLSAPRLPLLGGSKASLLGPNLAVRRGFRDPQLQRLIMLMFADIKAGCPTGSLYGESLSLALIEYLSERYCEPVPRTGSDRMALSGGQLKLVHDYIVANLAGDLTVVEMAALLNLSPNHFTVLFRNATGSTPHQYVLAERISAGRRLMENGRRSLAEIALAVGFSSQSHFATSFRRATGLTPRMYQKQRGLKPSAAGEAHVDRDDARPAFGARQ